MAKLTQEDFVTIKRLLTREQKNRAIARLLNVTEGAIRYHRRRRFGGTEFHDGRADKQFAAEKYAEIIKEQVRQHNETGNTRPVNMQELYVLLAEQYGYPWSYRSLVRYMRRHYPRPRIRTYRRVELPPGAQGQVDWKEDVPVLLGGMKIVLQLLLMVLSHSRMCAAVWCTRRDQLHWHQGHNEALRRLGGIPAVIRSDNLKTAVAVGAGPWGELNTAYRSYAKTVGFHPDACLPRAPEAKGKVERRIGHLLVSIMTLAGQNLTDQMALQAATDALVNRWAATALCAATGETVAESHRRERAFLQQITKLPEAFDTSVTRPVHRDCLVCFENRSYTVPFALVGERVEVRGCADTVQILHAGKIVAEYPRRTAARLLLDERCYEGDATERVVPPPPLGRLTARILELARQPVALRAADYYAALVEVAR